MTKNWIQLEKKTIFQTYKRQPTLLVKGKGSLVWDVKGKKYLDFFSGLGVNNLGHCHPKIVRAISSQSNKLIHTSNLYYTQPQIQLAENLVQRTFPGKVFFSNSGAEANECAFKLARRWAHSRGIEKGEIIAFKQSFHGRTLATLTLTGQEKFQKGFSPLLSKVLYADFNDIESVKRLISQRSCAVFVEPVQGEGGVYPAEPGFLKSLRKLCDQHHLLLIFDEVQCGLGRSGNLFCFQKYKVQPDVLTVAKGLGGGLPIGATIARNKIAALFSKGDHASTFGGNPVTCSAAISVLSLIAPKLLTSVQKKSHFIFSGLSDLKEKYPSLIQEVRGVGLMVGLELKIQGDPIVDFCRNQGLLINCTQNHVLRFLPPLTITVSELESTLSILDKSFHKFAARN